MTEWASPGAWIAAAIMTAWIVLAAFVLRAVALNDGEPEPKQDMAPVMDFADERLRKLNEHREWLTEWARIEPGPWQVIKDPAGTSAPVKVEPPKAPEDHYSAGGPVYPFGHHVVDWSGAHVLNLCRCGGNSCRMRAIDTYVSKEDNGT